MAGSAASQRMRAILVKASEHKPTLFLSEAPMPTVRPGNILVKVGAAGVNRMDLLQKAGVLQLQLHAWERSLSADFAFPCSCECVICVRLSGWPPIHLTAFGYTGV